MWDARDQQLHFPQEIEDDLRDCGLTEAERREVLNTAWEYVRCGIPEYTNRGRYITFVRLTALTTVAEYRGGLVDVDRILDPEGVVLGYPVRRMLHELFAGTGVEEEMALEYASSLWGMREKTSGRHSGLYRHYIEALAASPAAYFRLRDCDAQVRLFIAAAVACNDLSPDFSEAEYQAMAEIGMAMYDAVAFYKHRAEGEVCNAFAYCGPDLEFRTAAFAAARSTLWALDARWYGSVQGRCAVNLLRNLPLIHMAMRRYRFVEDGLVVGAPETSEVVRAARAHVKLWYRTDAGTSQTRPEPESAAPSLESVRSMLFPALAQALEPASVCPRCIHRASYGAAEEGQFGGVSLCDDCRETWRSYVSSSWARHEAVLSLRG